MNLWRNLDDKSRLLLLTGSIGLASQVWLQLDGLTDTGPDPALATLFGTFILMALGFRLDSRNGRNGHK